MEKQTFVGSSLKSYSAFLLKEEHLNSISADLFRRAKEMGLPMLKLYANFKEEEIIDQNKEKWREFLTNLCEGTELEKFKEKIEQWKKNQHPISLTDITSKDAVLIHSIRKFCLIKYLPLFASDIHEYHQIFLEIEDLFSQLKEITVTAYSDVQKNLFDKDKASILNLKDLLDTVVESSVDGIMAYDREHKVIIWNKALETINKIPKEEIIGKKIWEFFPIYNQQPFIDIVNSVLTDGKTIHLPVAEYKYKSGFYETYITPLINEAKEIQGVLTVVRDVTERVQNEKLIKEKNDFIEGITSSTPDLIFLFDLKELKHIYLSHHNSPIQVYNASVSGEKNILELLHPEDYFVLKARGERIMEAGDEEVIEDEFRALDINGNWRWLNSRIKVYRRDKNGKPLQTVGSIRDITERKEWEERLKANKQLLREVNEELEEKVAQRTQELYEKEAQLRIIANAIPALISYVDIDRVYRYVNKAYQIWFGVNPEDIVGKKVIDILGEQAYASIENYMDRVYKGERVDYETVIPYKSGGTRYIRASYVPHLSSEGKVVGYVSLVLDISEEKRNEEELRRSQSNLKDFVENATIGLHWVNKDGIIIWANQAEMNMLGYQPEEYIGQSIRKFHADEEAIEEILHCLSGKGTLKNYSARLLCKNGEIKDVLIDSSVYWENGEFVHTRCFTRDVSDQKLAEKEIMRKNDELQKINSDLDNFIYTASHDLKAPVSNIEGLLTALSDNLSEEVRSREEVTGILDLINVSITRFKNTIRDLTEISKVQKGLLESEEFNKVGDLINEIKSDIKDLVISYQAEIQTDLNVEEIQFSRKNLRSILYNLISNAIKYSSPDRKPMIEIRTEAAGDEVILSVKDNGLGINEAYIDKIFSMFKRAHDHVEGSGIGLYIVKRIIENSGGRIEVESEVGKGSVFRIFLKIL